jgi:hypothetical protein
MWASILPETALMLLSAGRLTHEKAGKSEMPYAGMLEEVLYYT